MKIVGEKNYSEFVNRNYNKIIVLIIFVQFLLVVFLASNKNGYECDDLLTLNDASSFYTGGRRFYQQAELFDTWHTKQEWRDSLTVNAEETIFLQSFETIWEVMMGNGKMFNCNLYMFLLNFIASFFPDSFSIWIAILFNFALFQVSQYIIVQISKEFIVDKVYWLYLMAFYGFATGILACIIYIRFYMLLTLMVLLLLWILIKMIHTNKLKVFVLYLVPLLITCYLGYRTHQYFAIYGALAILGTLFYLLITKQIKKVVIPICFGVGTFAVMMMSTNARGWLVYMLTKGEGAKQINSLLEWNEIVFWENLKNYGAFFYKHLIGNSFNLIVCIVGVLFSLYIAIAYRKKCKIQKRKLLMVLVISIALYMFFLIKVSSRAEWRYLSVIYAPTILCSVTLVYMVINPLKSKVVRNIFAWLGIIFLINMLKNDVRENGVDYIYYNDTQQRQILENNYADLDNLYVCQKNLWNLALDYNVMTEESRTMYVRGTEVANAEVFLDAYSKDAFLLWILVKDSDYTKEGEYKIIQNIKLTTEFDAVDYLFSTRYSKVYVVRKEQ